MDEFRDAAERRTAEYNLYFRIVSDGLSDSTVQEFQDELEGLAMRTVSPALRAKCLADMHRYDTLPDASGQVGAANLR